MCAPPATPQYERDPDPLGSARRVVQFSDFINTQRRSPEVQQRLDDLLRSGEGSVERRRSLPYTGALAEAERRDQERVLRRQFGGQAPEQGAPAPEPPQP